MQRNCENTVHTQLLNTPIFLTNYLLNRCFLLPNHCIDFSQLMEMSREVWQSSPNVISQLQMEAEKHRKDDRERKEKVRKLKVRP